MKRTLLLAISLFSGICSASAQATPLFGTSENIDIANIKAAHLVHGDMWWNPATGLPACEYPKGSGKNVGFTSSLWMGGYTAQNNLCFASQLYRNTGTDYWPGPIDTGTLATVSYATSTDWAKIWKITRTQIDSFKALTSHTSNNTPAPILEWPAMGNPYAKGANGAPLIINQPMAPFVDVNSDGKYDPMAGDYPAVKGDQMLWWVINDYGATPHNVSSANALGVDIKVSAYAYHRSNSADNIIFYEYQIRNHSDSAYSKFRMAIMADLDLGNPADDYAGFDSSHRLGFLYNGKSQDGTGRPGEYGTNPPIAGLAITEMPGDSYKNYVPAGSFVVVQNSLGPNGDPANGVEMYRTMNSSNRIGTPLPNGKSYELNEDAECVAGNLPGDRRFVISTKDMYLDTNETKRIGFALIVASGGGCPEFRPTNLEILADTAYKYYWNPPLQSTAVNSASLSQLSIYPNPASSILFMEAGASSLGSLSIYNTLGQDCTPAYSLKGGKIEIRILDLPAGIYTIRYKDQTGIRTTLFCKE